MLILGLAGQAGSGKNEVASYLAAHYGFVQFAFSDALYHEVQQAFGLENQDLLRDRATKDTLNRDLSLSTCFDEEFVRIGLDMLDQQAKREGGETTLPRNVRALSPRQILQWWGTEYRRAQDPDYWVKQAARFVTQMYFLPPYPELRPQFFVETGTRFENEREWITYKYLAGNTDGSVVDHAGQIWHIHRDATDKFTDSHASAAPLPILPGEREIWNNSTIEHLRLAVDLLLSTGNQFVRCEPMEPNTENS